MFIGCKREPFPYKHPWERSFEERIAALSARGRRIAYFYEAPDTSTFRYRVLNMTEALEISPHLGTSASWFCREDLPHLEDFIDRADALVVCRTHYDREINRMLTRARARGLPVLFDIDDLFFDTDYAHLILDTLDQSTESDTVWSDWFASISRTGATLRLCDSVIVTNPYLAERIREFAPWMVPHVIPNFLNRFQQSVSRQLLAAKRVSGFARDDRIHIGYFSGTPTHNRDFEIVEAALAKVLDEDPRLMVRMVGFLEPKGRMLRHKDRVEHYPLQDFLNLQRLIAETEINIAPLQINAFTNCKSELKYFEAAIVGTLTIASPSYTFATAIRDGDTGFLSTAQEWERKLKAAISLVDDMDQYTTFSERAYLHAEKHYSWDAYGDQIAQAIFPTEAQELYFTTTQCT